MPNIMSRISGSTMSWFSCSQDDFDFGGFDAFVHEHAVLDLLDEEWAGRGRRGGEGHVDEGVAFSSMWTW